MKKHYIVYKAKVLHEFNLGGFRFLKDTKHLVRNDNGEMYIERPDVIGRHLFGIKNHKIEDKIEINVQKIFLRFKRGDIVIRKDADKETIPTVISSHTLNNTYIWYQDTWGDYTNCSSGHDQETIRLASPQEIQQHKTFIDIALKQLREIEEREAMEVDRVHELIN